MRKTIVWGVSAATLLTMGCHPTAQEYAAKDLEAQGYKKKLDDQSQKTADLEKKVAELDARITSLDADKKSLEDKVKADEDNLSAKQTDLKATQDKVTELQALNDELSKSKRKLEEAKQELEKKSAAYEQLAGSLKTEIEAGKIELSELRGKMTVKMKDKILFSSGSATLGREGKEALEKVAEALKSIQGKMIRVEGHTDNVPTGGGAFPTNWELSNARAIAVVRYLQEKGVDPTLLAAAGYSQYQPVASNDTPEGRSLNRRIEIVLAPADGAANGPSASAASSAHAPN